MEPHRFASPSTSPFRIPLFAGILCLLLLLPFPGGGARAAGGGEFPPWDFGKTAASPRAEGPEVRGGTGPAARILLAGLSFFSESISRVDGDRCPMYPTCSAYSRLAVRKHGFFLGIMMTADRLIHEATEMEYAPLVLADRLRYYDPVENNDFWWAKD